MYEIKLFILKLIGKFSKKIGHGSSIVGYLDKKLKFNILKEVDFTNKEVIFVVGTNGKTSITNGLYQIFQENGKSVLSNLEGANLEAGIKTAIIMNLKNKQIKQDILLLEVDEKTVTSISELIPPTQIILTNFFRDQLDRYFEIELVIDEIFQKIEKFQPTIFYNAQDPLIYNWIKASKAPKVSFLLNEDDTTFDKQTGIVEIIYCPKCLTKLKYNYYHYAHIGDFSCPNPTCDFQRQEPDYIFNHYDNVLEINNEIVYSSQTKEQKYFLINTCLIATVAMHNKISASKIKKTLSNRILIHGRNNRLNINGKQVYLNLCKNVAGMEETLRFLAAQDKKINLLIAFNDNYADGKDVSWIWDVNFTCIFENLNKLNIVGTRKKDMQLRFLYENYMEAKTFETIEKGLDDIFLENEIYIISNYTPLEQINSYLKKIK